jgi:hypothetical protein
MNLRLLSFQRHVCYAFESIKQRDSVKEVNQRTDKVAMSEGVLPKTSINIFGNSPDKRLKDIENQVDGNKDNYPCYNYLVLSA